MADYSNVIHVPKPEPNSYDANRPAGKLLQAQCAHLREALIHHLQDLVAVLAIDPRSLKTESDCSSYVAKATVILHTRSAIRRDE